LSHRCKYNMQTVNKQEKKSDHFWPPLFDRNDGLG